MLTRKKTLSEEELLQATVAVIRKHLGENVEKIFLFGSRARRDSINPRVDIDIGYFCNPPASLKQKFAVEDDIENIPSLLKIDLVDFSETGDRFKKEALKEVRVLYEKRWAAKTIWRSDQAL